MPKTSAPPPSMNILRREVKHRVFVPVNEDEIPNLTLQLCEALAKDEDLKKRGKAVADEFKGLRAEQQEISAALREQITQGNVQQMMCEEIKDFGAGTVKYFRLDTKELIDQRKITEEDNQLEAGHQAS